MNSKSSSPLAMILLALVWSVSAVQAQSAKEATLFTNVKVFNGVDEKLLDTDVLVMGNLIKQVSKDIKAPGGARVIDGGGRVLMPGLIDAHWHMFNPLTVQDVMTAHTDYIHAKIAVEAKKTLLRGFTTIREPGGQSFGLKRAIDEGILEGPRILPSGAPISQSSGHFDYTQPWELPTRLGGQPSRPEAFGMLMVVDGADDALAAARYNLKQGASQLKIAGGGGVASNYDPLDVSELTVEEMEAVVAAAKNWNTYVAVHVYTAKGIKRALEAGVMSIEHGHFLDEETARLMKEKDAWLGIQPFQEGDPSQMTLPPEGKAKWSQTVKGFENAMDLAVKYDLNLSYGTDFLFDPASNGQQASQLARFGKWLSNVEMLKLITSENARLLELSGERHPYRQGPLGVIREGAYADILLVDKNPLDDVSILGDGGKNFSLIMKDGKIFKNQL
jgi:imidazolonepropionase-like amidohydrolase